MGKLLVALEMEEKEYELNEDFISCLNDEPKAFKHFNGLTKGHQSYLSKWVETAKTIETKTCRITKAVDALAKGFGYPEMIKEGNENLL